MKNILCYGDSNTWGFIPVEGERYPRSIRWPGAMQALLGEGYHVMECGLNGRTSAYDNPYAPMMNGMDGTTVL